MRIPPVTVLLALFAFTLAHPGFAGAEEDLQLFFSSGYSYCDARTLAAYWKVDISEAKARIGATVRRGTPQQAAQQVALARKKLKGPARVQCEYWETNYTYEDATALAAAWGTDLPEAKARIGREVSQGRQKALDTKLRALGRTPGQADPEAEALNAYWNSGLAYCDAELVAALWGADVSQVKVSLGLKIVGRNQDLLNSELRRARDAAHTSGQRCEFWATPYSSEDASALATFWGVALDAAKAQMAKAYTLGGRPALASQLAAARGGR